MVNSTKSGFRVLSNAAGTVQVSQQKAQPAVVQYTPNATRSVSGLSFAAKVGLVAIFAVMFWGVHEWWSGMEKSEAVAALRKSYAPLRDMESIVSAGTTFDEYSHRVTDEMLQFNHSEDGLKEAIAKISQPNQRAVAEQAQHHMEQAMEAYVAAKDYFGDTHKTDLDPFEDHNLADGKAYRELRTSILNLEDLQPLPHSDIYWKGDVLQALWSAAAQDSQAAEAAINELQGE